MSARLAGVRSVVVLLSVSVGVASAQTTHVVNQVGFTFVPADITVNPGDTVEWHWFSGIHTVTSGTPLRAGRSSVQFAVYRRQPSITPSPQTARASTVMVPVIPKKQCGMQT